MEHQPSYYSILPAVIRYSKNLSFFQKVLFSEITALSNKDGYCSAGNGYFATIYEMEEETISRAISKLRKEGAIKVFIDKAAGNDRKIYPCDQHTLLTNLSIAIDEKVNTPIDEKVNIIIQEYNTKPISKDIGIKKSEIEILNLEETRAKFRESFPDADVDLEIEKAIDYIKAHGRRLKDYVAFMRNWMRNSHKFTPKNNNNGQRKTTGVISQSDFAEVVATLQQR